MTFQHYKIHNLDPSSTLGPVFFDPTPLLTAMVPEVVEMAGAGPERRMQGEGSIDVLLAVNEAVKAADQLAFGPVGTTASNLLSHAFNKNPNWRPGFSGERHLVLPTKDGLTRANFAGPGTKLKKRLPRGDMGVDGPRGIDQAAMQHDIDYSNSTTAADIRGADKRFIARVGRSSAGPKTKALVKAAMKGKVFAEDLGVLNPLKFASKGQGRVLNTAATSIALMKAKAKAKAAIAKAARVNASRAKSRGKPVTGGPLRVKKKPVRGKVRPGMRLREKLKKQGLL